MKPPPPQDPFHRIRNKLASLRINIEVLEESAIEFSQSAPPLSPKLSEQLHLIKTLSRECVALMPALEEELNKTQHVIRTTPTA